MDGYIKYLISSGGQILVATYYHNLMGCYWHVEGIPRALPNLCDVPYGEIVEVERSSELQGFVHTFF